MTGMRNRAAMAAAFCSAAARYWLSVYPEVRREAEHWRRAAQEIPDPILRRLALQNLEAERSDLDGAAAFAAFAPHEYRTAVVRAAVAFQAIYDYVDSISEQSPLHATKNARQLHFALLDALTPGLPHGHYYAHFPRQRDNGYLAGLVERCQEAVATLPAYPTVAALARLNAHRIIEYQALINYEPHADYHAFAQWATSENVSSADLKWWELGAACGSSLGVFALIAGAAKPQFQRCDALNVEDAYYPWIGSLHTLLDSLIDYDIDIEAGQHSLIGHYRSRTETADRMKFIAREAAWQAQALPDGPSHMLLLVAMASLYLCSREASLPPARPTREAIIPMLGKMTTPTMLVLGLHRAARQVHAKRRDRGTARRG